MNKAYERINWENYPSENTALNEANLNKMDAALNEVDNRVVAHETTKLDVATANSMVEDVDFDETTGIFTITFLNGVTKTLDTKLEKIATNFRYDYATQKLILTLVDGTTQEIDMSALLTQYEFENSAHINWTVVDGKVKAEIINGSITADKLQPNFLADVTLQANNAKTSEQNAKVSEENAKQSEINAKNYAESAEPVASTANGLNPTLENSTDAPFISFNGDGKTTQAIEKYFIELTEVSGGVQTNIIDCKSGDEVVLDCGVARTIGYYVYLEDGSSMYEEGSANVQVYTFTAGGKMQFIIKGGTLGDNITITVNGSEYNNPSPDNPVPIHGVGESGSLEVKSTGKNLFDIEKFLNDNNVPFEKSGNTYETYTSLDLYNNHFVFSDTDIDVTISGTVSDISSVNARITLFDRNDNTVVYGFTGGAITVKASKLRFDYSTGGTVSYDSIQIEKGNTATPYEPYQGETTANIPLSAPLYDGDYIRYNMDGSGEESHNFIRITLDGSDDEGWRKGGIFTTFYCRLFSAKQAKDDFNSGNVEGFCSHFTMSESYRAMQSIDGYGHCGFGIYTGSIDTCFGVYTNHETLQDLKAWLAENPVTVVYELAEPTVTPLTAEQIADFKKLQTFDGTTHVTCEAESEIQYFYDSVSGKAVAMIANMLKK